MKRSLALLFLLCALKLCAYEAHVLLDSPFPDHKIEVEMQKSAESNGRLVLVLHEGSSHTMQHWYQKGYAVASIALPGYGGSTGMCDYCGSFTLDTLHYALDFIKEELHVKQLAIIGFGQGGLAATLLGTQRKDIACIVCANGGYDLLRHNTPGDALIERLQEKGVVLDFDSEEELASRSPILHVCEIEAPIFVVHRRENFLISESEVNDFFSAMCHAGKSCTLSFIEASVENKISSREVLDESEEWLEGCLQTYCHCFSIL